MLDRTIAPPIQPLARVTLPATDVQLLPGGARLHVLANDAQPVVRLQVVFRAGKMAELQPGLALLTARMLLEGTATRTARQIADEVAFFGASLDADAGPDRATVTLYCLTRHLSALLPLLLDVLTNPAFPADELAQMKTRTIQNVRVERQKTSYLAAERFNQSIFGNDSAYGRPFDGETFQNLTADEARAFHRQAYVLNGAELFLSGDVATLSTQVAEAFSALTDSASPGSPAVGTQEMPQLAVPATDHVTVPDSLQASLRVGRPWPSLTHPDTHRLQLLVKVLGGYFGSRLMRNIREDKGFTYGIYSSVVPREQANILVIGTDVNGDSGPAALAEISHELYQLQEELISADELETVKSYVLGKFANELSTVFEQADKYRNLVLLSLPATYHSDFVRDTEQATAEELRELAREYLSPEAMLTVVAGQ